MRSVPPQLEMEKSVLPLINTTERTQCEKNESTTLQKRRSPS